MTMDKADKTASLSSCKTLSNLVPLALPNALMGVASLTRCDCTRSLKLPARLPSARKEMKKDNPESLLGFGELSVAQFCVCNGNKHDKLKSYFPLLADFATSSGCQTKETHRHKTRRSCVHSETACIWLKIRQFRYSFNGWEGLAAANPSSFLLPVDKNVRKITSVSVALS